MTKSPEPNPRIMIGSNSGDLVGEAELSQKLHNVRARVNTAAMRKRHAAEKMRDHKRDFQSAHPEVYATIESMRKAALQEMQSKLGTLPGYQEAVTDKKTAADALKAATKEAKANGIDMQVFKIANKMGELDPLEAEDFFDRLDMYCKAMKLWGRSYG